LEDQPASLTNAINHRNSMEVTTVERAAMSTIAQGAIRNRFTHGICPAARGSDMHVLDV
jgi:hypothetical protein